MSRQRFVIRDGNVVEVDLDWTPPPRQGLAAPYLKRDQMDPTWHPATGKMFESKAAFRAETKAAGCVEVGDDSSLTAPRKAILPSKEKRVEDIKKAIDDLSSGRVKPPAPIQEIA